MDLKRRADMVALRRGLSLNSLVVMILEEACPPSNPVMDDAEELASLARQYDAEMSPAELGRKLRAVAQRLQSRLDEIPEE